jgi:hypothetical protein
LKLENTGLMSIKQRLRQAAEWTGNLLLAPYSIEIWGQIRFKASSVGSGFEFFRVRRCKDSEPFGPRFEDIEGFSIRGFRNPEMDRSAPSENEQASNVLPSREEPDQECDLETAA